VVCGLCRGCKGELVAAGGVVLRHKWRVDCTGMRQMAQIWSLHRHAFACCQSSLPAASGGQAPTRPASTSSGSPAGTLPPRLTHLGKDIRNWCTADAQSPGTPNWLEPSPADKWASRQAGVGGRRGSSREMPVDGRGRLAACCTPAHVCLLAGLARGLQVAAPCQDSVLQCSAHSSEQECSWLAGGSGSPPKKLPLSVPRLPAASCSCRNQRPQSPRAPLLAGQKAGSASCRH
jgi:hypothetical protein